MQTDKVRIDNTGNGLKEALSEAERLAAFLQLEKKDALRFRLLSEEAIGMVSAVTGSFRGFFWMEVSDRKDLKIHVETNDKISYGTKQDLISLSASGRNESEKGFMAKVLSLMERGMHSIEEVNRLEMEYGGMPLMFGSMGMYEMSEAAMTGIWSLSTYRDKLEEEQDASGEREEVREALADLEKSIVAGIADDVKVYVKPGHAEIVIEKRF